MADIDRPRNQIEKLVQFSKADLPLFLKIGPVFQFMISGESFTTRCHCLLFNFMAEKQNNRKN